MTRLDTRDPRNAEAIASESAPVYARCPETNEAGARCVYGEGHRVERHLFFVDRRYV